jgi:hypothetical protein
MPPNEYMMEQAIQAMNSGAHTSVQAYAAAFGVAKTTLQEHINGRTNLRNSYQHQQRLTPLQEDFLVEWILEED